MTLLWLPKNYRGTPYLRGPLSLIGVPFWRASPAKLLSQQTNGGLVPGIQQLAELVIELTGSSSKIVRHPLPQDDPKQRCPDISLAKSVLGWQPQIHLREGLKRTIDYFDLLLREKKA